jgi:hypothetical protein
MLVSIYLIFVYFISFKIFTIFLESKQYFEPAENENLVMSIFQKKYFYPDYYEGVEKGLMVIYEYFFHTIIGLFEDDLLIR